MPQRVNAGAFLLAGRDMQGAEQRLPVALCIPVDLRDARNNDGRGMACCIQDVGLDDQRGPAPFTGPFFMSVGFKINLPQLAALQAHSLIQGCYQTMRPPFRFQASAYQRTVWTNTPCGISAPARFSHAPPRASTQSWAC